MPPRHPGSPTDLPPPGEVPPQAADLYAEHGEPGDFFNPWGPMPQGPLAVLRWWLSPSRYDKSGPMDLPRAAAPPERLDGAEPALTWIGHASFAIEGGGSVLLTDPHFGDRALLPRRKTPPGIPLEAVPEDAVALLSHNHYDHLDRWTVKRLPPGVSWYVPPGMAGWFRRHGVTRVTEVGWWQRVEHGPWALTALPAQHWSNRISQGRNAAGWCSWLIEAAGDGAASQRRYYFAGDSGYFHGFAEIGRRFPSIDVALLPIGAYEPRWFMAYQHMDPPQALRAFHDLGARHMVGMHWGTFDLTDEPVDLAPRVLARVVAAHGGDDRVRVMAVGERWPVPGSARGSENATGPGMMRP